MSTSHSQLDAIVGAQVATVPATSGDIGAKFDKVLVCDTLLSEQLIKDRQERGIDQHDEVWEGVYMMSPLANLEHQFIAFELAHAFRSGLGRDTGALILVGVNVSDRDENWKHNFRCPDVAAYLKDTAAKLHDAYTRGGPDFAVEVVSKNDMTREKLGFYGKVGVRELLIVDRDPWQLELLRLGDDKLVSVGISAVEGSETLTSEVIPFTFKLEKSEQRPVIVVGHTESGHTWRV